MRILKRTCAIWLSAIGMLVLIAVPQQAVGQDGCSSYTAGGAPTPIGTCHYARIGLVPPASHVNSLGFRVTNVGTLRVVVSVKTYTANVGSSRYKVSLRRGLPGSNAAIPSGVEVASGEVVAGSTSREVNLTTSLDDCGDTGTFHVRVSNSSTDNPQIGEAAVYYGFPPLTSKEMRLNLPLDKLGRSNEAERSIGSIDKSGLLVVKGKWHVAALIPTYALLSISLRRPDGSTAVGTKQYWSFHHPSGIPKFSVSYRVTDQDARMSGQWKLAIKNGPDHEVSGFDIRKGNDLNPFVPSFTSKFTNGCGQ